MTGVQQRAELVRYDAKSGDFAPYLGGISAGDVDFSRDGQWVTYVSYPDDTLWRSKLDGSARLQLTYPPMRTGLGHWSPDGQQIAFAGALPGKPWKVYLISKDGGSPQSLVSKTEELQEADPHGPRTGIRLLLDTPVSVPIPMWRSSSCSILKLTRFRSCRVPTDSSVLAGRLMAATSSPFRRTVISLCCATLRTINGGSWT